MHAIWDTLLYIYTIYLYNNLSSKNSVKIIRFLKKILLNSSQEVWTPVKKKITIICRFFHTFFCHNCPYIVKFLINDSTSLTNPPFSIFSLYIKSSLIHLTFILYINPKEEKSYIFEMSY